MGRIVADMGEMKAAMTKLNSRMKNQLERVSDALGFGLEGTDSSVLEESGSYQKFSVDGFDNCKKPGFSAK
jgi:hypothetical protein